MSDVDEEFEHEEAFPRLSRDLLAVLEAAGERRTLAQVRSSVAPARLHASSAW
jgi:hypothetical protein